jgi:hypothetical protein
MLKIGFMTTLGVNVGDEFIREGIRTVLDRTKIPYAPLYVNKHDPNTLSQPYEDEPLVVQDKFWDCNIFIQAGAPVYWHLLGGRSRSMNSEWHQWLWEDRILAQGPRMAPMFLNLGAGSCQPWKENGDSFLGDQECREFAERAGQRAALTAVRDEVASRILRALGIPHEPICCPAFLAGARHQLNNSVPDLIGINLMPLGAHYDLSGNFNAEVWKQRCHVLCESLRRLGRLMFVCHDATERDYASLWAQPGERVFIGEGWRDYLDVYSSCQVVVANRVHGAVCAAGFGVPSIIMGNDTRAQIGEYLGLPIFGSAELDPTDVIRCVIQLLDRRHQESQRLVQLRDATIANYLRLIQPLLHQAMTVSPARLAA